MKNPAIEYEIMQMERIVARVATKGLFPKAWIRTEDGFVLLKDGGEDIVRRELLASRICQCFDIPQVVYSEGKYDDQAVTQSRIVTSKDYSMVSKMAYDTIDGANCQTVCPKRQNQREAALEAVQKIGLRQIRDVDMAWFEGMEKEAEMFQQRLDVLKAV